MSRFAQPARTNPVSVARQSCRSDFFILLIRRSRVIGPRMRPNLWQSDAPRSIFSLMIEQRDLAVWGASALLAFGIGWSRYAKNKTRNNLVRQLAAMEPEQRSR